MLKFLRQKKTVKILLWIIAVVIIIAFVLWGTPTRFGDKENKIPRYAGEIFGEKIPFDNFVEAYQASRNQAIMVYGEDFQKYSQFINLEEDAWSRLILLSAAKDENITVTNKEVIDRIKSFPFFQKDGKFDLQTYQMVLNYVFRATPRKYEEQIRQSLLIEKLSQKILSGFSLSEERVEAEYAQENDTVQATYALIEKNDFKNSVTAQEEDLVKFYEAHQEKFRKPKQVNVNYIYVDLLAQKEKTQAAEEEINDYYLQNKEQFKKPAEEKPQTDGQDSGYKGLEEVREEIKNIILTEKSQEKALDLAYRISDFIYEGRSIKEASEKFSLPLGETGFFSGTDPIAEIGWSYQFLMAAFQLEKNQVSDIVQTPKGYYMLSLIDKKEPHIPLLEQIKKEVSEALIEEKAALKAREKVLNILAAIQEEKSKGDFDFSKTIESLNLTPQKTEPFKRDSYIQNIGQSTEFTEESFRLKKGEISGIIEVPKGYVIIKIDEKTPFDRNTFLQEKETFRNNLIQREKQQYYGQWFENLKEKAALKSSLSSFFKE